MDLFNENFVPVAEIDGFMIWIKKGMVNLDLPGLSNEAYRRIVKLKSENTILDGSKDFYKLAKNKLDKSIR